MKALAIGTVALVCLAMGGCATTGRDRTASQVDVGKVLAVNQWAARRHATVLWINSPELPPGRASEG